MPRIIALVFVLIAGCSSSHGPLVDEPIRAEACIPSARQWRTDYTPYQYPYGPVDLRISPNGELLHLGSYLYGGSRFVRIADGSSVGEGFFGSTLAPSWNRVVEQGWDDTAQIATVRDMPSGDVELELRTPISDPEGWHNDPVFQLSDSGEVLYVLESWRRGDEERAFIRKVAIDGSEPERRVDLPPSGYVWNRRTHILESESPSQVVVAGLQFGVIASVDFESGDVVVLGAEVVVEPPTDWGGPMLSGAAISRDGTLLALVHVVDAPGEMQRSVLRVLESRSFAVLLERDAGTFTVNRNSYVPADVSPVAFSTDGRRLAFQDVDGSVALLDLESETILERFSIEESTEHPPWPVAPKATGFLFDDDNGLLIAHEEGVELYRCESDPARDPMEEVRIVLDESPMHVTAGATFQVRFHLEGTTHPTVRWFDAGDQGVLATTLSDRAELTLYATGTRDVILRVSDGAREGTLTLPMVVMAP